MKKTLFWLRKSASQNFIEAQYFFFCMHEFLPGTEKKAIKLLKRAAHSGHIGAQIELGSCYLTGKIVCRDLDKSRYWCSFASLSGHGHAIYLLSLVYKEQGDIEKFLKYLNQACDTGSPYALTHKGILCECGIFIDRNPILARNLIQKGYIYDQAYGVSMLHRISQFPYRLRINYS